LPRLKYPPPLTLVEIEWEDIFESVVGDPSESNTAHRVTSGYFLKKTRNKKGRTIVVTCGTLEIDEDGKRSPGDQSGWCSYPVGTIMAIHWHESEAPSDRSSPSPAPAPDPSDTIES
jgi:hypothetical protein